MAISTADWLHLNLGIVPSPITIEDVPPIEDIQRQIIDFDSEGPDGATFFAFAAGATGLSRFVDIPWPKGLAPKPASRVAQRPTAKLPKADVLVVTWTVDEGHALSRVLTPGYDSKNDWKEYKHNFTTLKKQFRRGSPALQAGRLGTYWMTTINRRKVLCFKSESHLSQDGPKVPNFALWRQLIDEVKPSLVITTGTGGGIGKQWEVGDVIVSPFVHFYCKAKFVHAPFAHAKYRAANGVPKDYFAKATALFKSNANQLPNTNTRKIPRIALSNSWTTSIVTTDFFGFDTSQNTYKLRGEGNLSEMGDAVLGAVMKELGARAPAWVAVRNVSDPQINEPKKPLPVQANDAATIYKGFGRWSSVCSAIVCWALIASRRSWS